jgi:hypothetical protein
LEENPSNLPQTLQNTANVVLDGFLNPVDIQTYPLKDKSVYFNHSKILSCFLQFQTPI